jgi:hypothetical protein
LALGLSERSIDGLLSEHVSLGLKGQDIIQKVSMRIGRTNPIIKKKLSK